MTKFRALLAIVLVLSLGASAFAQRLDGTLRGEVTDQSGAVVAGAKVKVTNPQTGVTNSTTTTWDPLESTCRHASLSIL